MRKLTINTVRNTIEELKKIKRQVAYSLRQRIQVIILALQGKQGCQIVSYLGISEPTLYKYIRLYNVGGVEDLLEVKKSTGRPSKLTIEQQLELKELIKKSPQEIGFGESVNWTCPIISEYILEEYNIKLTKTAVREMLVRNNMSYTRPTYVLAKADIEKQEEFKKNA